MINYRNIVAKYRRELDKKVYGLEKSNQTLVQKEQSLKKFIDSYAIADEFKERFAQERSLIEEKVVSEAKRRYQWVKANTNDFNADIETIKAIKQTDNDFVKIGSDIAKRSIKAITESIKKGVPTIEVIDTLKRVLSKPSANAFAVANAGLKEYDQRASHEFAEKAGITEYIYIGSKPQRGFCQRYLNEVMQKAEILQLSNGQGLGVFEHGGGWNCAHWWEPYLRPISKTNFSKLEDNPNIRPQAGKVINSLSDSQHIKNVNGIIKVQSKYSKSDLRQDFTDHADGFALKNKEYYVAKANYIKMTAGEVRVQAFRNKVQYLFISDEGVSVVDVNKEIRGCYTKDKNWDTAYDTYLKRSKKITG